MQEISLDSDSEVSRLQEKELEYFKFKNGRDSPSEAWGTLLIITTLVASATFHVESGKTIISQTKTNNTSKKHVAGLSILGTSN